LVLWWLKLDINGNRSLAGNVSSRASINKKASELVKLPEIPPGIATLHVDPAKLPSPILAYDHCGKLEKMMGSPLDFSKLSHAA
jgi:hypothetical protein